MDEEKLEGGASESAGSCLRRPINRPHILAREIGSRRWSKAGRRHARGLSPVSIQASS